MAVNISKLAAKLKTSVRASSKTFDLISSIFEVVSKEPGGRIKSPVDIAVIKFYKHKQSPYIINITRKMSKKTVSLMHKSGFLEFLCLPLLLPPNKLSDIIANLAIYSDIYKRIELKVAKVVMLLDINSPSLFKRNIKTLCSSFSEMDMSSERDKEEIEKWKIEKDEVVKKNLQKKLLGIVKKKETAREERIKRKTKHNNTLSKENTEKVNKMLFSKRDLEYVDKFRAGREKRAKVGVDGLIELVKMFNKLGIKTRKDFYINSKKLDKMGAMRVLGYEVPPKGPTGKPMSIKDAVKVSFSEEPSKRDLILFKYQDGFFYGMITDPKNGGWSDSMRVARGIIVDRKKLKVVVSPQGKFFNIATKGDEHVESPDSLVDNMPQDEPFETVEKVDGVQIMVSEYNGSLLFNTNGSIDSNYCEIARKIIDTKYRSIKSKLIKWLRDTESTLCFELIDPQANIVVDYSIGGSRKWVYPDGKIGDDVWKDGIYPSELVLHSWIQRG